jgi:hypothetical protein
VSDAVACAALGEFTLPERKTSTGEDPLQALREALRRFAAERDWETLHKSKSLAMALSVEAGELLEHFQWLTAEESGQLTEEQKAQVSQEMAVGGLDHYCDAVENIVGFNTWDIRWVLASIFEVPLLWTKSSLHSCHPNYCGQ